MAKRDLTDQEVSLIKGMIAKGMANDKVHFYFNRMDRLLSPGRISNIKLSKYAPEISAADVVAVDAFLTAFEASTPKSQQADNPGFEELARAMFEKRARTGWFLKTHETEAAECKESFRLSPENRFADALRSIAGLANNDGGFLFFGVCEKPDGSLSVDGLKDDCFANTDPSELNRCLAGALDPVPVFSKFMLDFEGKSVGVLRVEKHDFPPVIAIKNINNEVKEGGIYYRYVGETRAIKPGELRQIISYREQKAVSDFSNRMAKIAVGAAATLDLDSGKVDGSNGSFLIDENLLSKIQFIREGDFREAEGAPALKLVGEVSAIGSPTELPTKLIRDKVGENDILRNFLEQQKVQLPEAYIRQGIDLQRKWLPIFYYLKQMGTSATELADQLAKEKTSHTVKRDELVKRLRGKMTARLAKPATKLQGSLATKIERGEMPDFNSAKEALQFADALTCVQKSAASLDVILKELGRARDLVDAQEPKQIGRICKAACRIDELYFCV